MDDRDKPPDAMYDTYKSYKEPTAKEKALEIYNILQKDKQILYELNVLLRKNKIKEIENNE